MIYVMIHRHFVGIVGYNLWSWGAKIWCVIQTKLNQFVEGNVRMIANLPTKRVIGDITAMNIYKSFTHKMAAMTSRHRCGTKLRNCYPMYMNAKESASQYWRTDYIQAMRNEAGRLGSVLLKNYGQHIKLQCLQCFDAVGWAAGKASGL